MSDNKKIVIQVDVHDNNDKRKALKAVSSHPGIESIAMDIKDKKLTIIGVIDPVCVVRKLKKFNPKILSVGPAKDEKKDDKKDVKKDDDKKTKEEQDFIKWMEYNRLYYPYMTPHFCVHSVDDYPNSCVIC